MKKLLENIRKLWKQYVVFTLIFILAILFYLSLEANSKTSEAIVAFGTLVLALVTALSIINSNEQEKRDRKERLLNEIIEWGKFIASWSESKIAQGLTRDYPIDGNVISIICDRIGKQIDDISAINGKNIYILKLSKTFDAELRNSIVDTINQIDTLKIFLIQWKTEIEREIDKGAISIGIDKNELSKISNIDTYISNLIGNAEKIIEETTRIKTQDINLGF
jgi:hypothetical protein